MSAHLLSLILFLPLAGAIATWLTGLFGKSDKATRAVAFVSSMAVLAISIVLLVKYQIVPKTGRMQFLESATWIPSLGINYALGIDGISLFLVLLTTAITPIVIVSARVSKGLAGYLALLLALETGMLGAFLALDVVLFYVFWEAMLVPMYFLIGIWGGERRIYAAVKFFLYTAAGSLLMLVALLYVFMAFKTQTNVYSGAIFDLWSVSLTHTEQLWLFAAFALAFAIKVPMFPLHTWLPDAHVQAPTGGSVVLAAVMLKMGTYGFLRWALPMFPSAAMTLAPLFLSLSAIGIVYGALVAMVQPDMKKLIAYSSVSHLGFVMLGLFAFDSAAVTGSVMQMVNHGISTGALFLLVGVVYDRLHTREIAHFGGLAKVMPMYAAIFLLVTLSSIGLPGTNGFVGEFLILIGTFRAAPLAAAVGGLGVVLGAVYMLWLYTK